MRKHFLVLSLALVLLSPVQALGTPQVVLDAMEEELQRNLRELSVPDYPAPYFLAYLLRDDWSVSYRVRFGAAVQDLVTEGRLLYADVRVGSPALDNSEDPYPEFTSPMRMQVFQNVAPLEQNLTALKKTLWMLTDTRYKEAVASFMKVKAQNIYETTDPDFKGSFGKAEPVVYLGEEIPVPESLDTAKELATRASQFLDGYDFVFDSLVSFEARRENRYFVNSEGTRLFESALMFVLAIEAYARADDGTVLPYSIAVYARTPEQLPTWEALEPRLATMMDELKALSHAELMEPYSGPALLEGDTAGVFIHEALGHRLEGHRQDGDMEGGTFKGKMGDAILPEFVTIVDDPTLESFDGQGVNGFYRYDDEGVAGQKVPLVTQGKLSGFLLTRRPTRDGEQSNGHARASGLERPVARMGTLVVTGTKTLSQEKLKKRLMELARKQGKPYAIILRRAASGATNTSRWGFQAFKGVARLVIRVDARTGEETLVRGVELVGTPLSSLMKVDALGEEPVLFNGYCGAESGMVPVSMITPSILMQELEFQKSPSIRERPEILPPPK